MFRPARRITWQRRRGRNSCLTSQEPFEERRVGCATRREVLNRYRNANERGGDRSFCRMVEGAPCQRQGLGTTADLTPEDAAMLVPEMRTTVEMRQGARAPKGAVEERNTLRDLLARIVRHRALMNPENRRLRGQASLASVEQAELAKARGAAQ